ncbi:hypothetical protein [Embleya sp. NPDC005575]|uniref:hypothetical protein n=1 Tax=Embleya sp. NPDC005575 TaxID=3156892 RepID=UPI0033BA00E5
MRLGSGEVLFGVPVVDEVPFGVAEFEVVEFGVAPVGEPVAGWPELGVPVPGDVGPVPLVVEAPVVGPPVVGVAPPAGRVAVGVAAEFVVAEVPLLPPELAVVAGAEPAPGPVPIAVLAPVLVAAVVAAAGLVVDTLVVVLGPDVEGVVDDAEPIEDELLVPGAVLVDALVVCTPPPAWLPLGPGEPVTDGEPPIEGVLPPLGVPPVPGMPPGCRPSLGGACTYVLFCDEPPSWLGTPRGASLPWPVTPAGASVAGGAAAEALWVATGVCVGL